MNYEDAMREWGARKLEQAKAKTPIVIDRGTVQVDLKAECECFGGCDTCGHGGSDAEYYCQIMGNSKGSKFACELIYSFSYMDLLRELLEVAEGTITS